MQIYVSSLFKITRGTNNWTQSNGINIKTKFPGPLFIKAALAHKRAEYWSCRLQEKSSESSFWKLKHEFRYL